MPEFTLPAPVRIYEFGYSLDPYTGESGERYYYNRNTDSPDFYPVPLVSYKAEDSWVEYVEDI